MQRHPPPPPSAPPYLWVVDLALCVVAAAGIFGAIRVSDALDPVRWPLLHWLGVPGALFYLASRLLYPHWPALRPRCAGWLLGTLFLIFGLGAFTLINALTTDGVRLKRTIEQGPGLALRDVQRGGLGLLFKTRTTW